MRTLTIAKIATGIGTAALLFCLAAGAGVAAGRPGGGQAGFSGGGGGGHPAFGGGGGHPAFGGGGHPAFGGGAPHFAPQIRGGAPHFAAHVGAAPHFARHAFAPRAHVGRVGRPATSHFARRAGSGRIGRQAFHGRIHTHARITRATPSLGRTPHGTSANRHGTITRGRTANLRTGVPRVAGRTGARNFAAHRHLAGIDAFHPFFGHGWHRHRHLGWIGPWFWPYAYGDFFYDALWPDEYAYYDPFWYYGYNDIYEGIFTPYDYQPYVQGPDAPARMTALTQSVAQSCTDEAAEITGWPIDQIQAAVQPKAQQSALLDALGNAVVKASDVVSSHCPTQVSFTPTGRLAAMQQRLEGLVQSVNIVQPPLSKFYDALSDEQKARFNEIGAAAGRPPAQEKQAAQNPQAECGQNVMAFPTDKIDQIVHPNDAQRGKLDALQTANAEAAELIKASCPSELPATPPDRLAAEGKHLQAMLKAVQTIRPPLEDFYNSLSEEQKARFNNLGRQLFAQK
jgi:hypothetical protein